MALPADQLEDRPALLPIATTFGRLASEPPSHSAEPSTHEVQAARPTSSKRCRVLLVEDDAPIAELYATVLEANGHTVTHAVDGLDGLDAIRSGDFDIILLDIRMPRMDGLAMLRKIIDEQIATDTPVVILTNYDDSALRQEAADLGAKDYLLKSRTMPQEIAAQVAKWCTGPANPTSAP